jgi:hypothetical protein
VDNNELLYIAEYAVSERLLVRLAFDTTLKHYIGKFYLWVALLLFDVIYVDAAQYMLSGTLHEGPGSRVSNIKTYVI